MRRYRLLRPKLFLFLLLAPLAGCQDLGPGGPRGPGVIHVDLVSPNGAEGSAVFQLQGGAELDMVTSFGGEVFYDHDDAAGTTSVVVIMEVPGDISFKVQSRNVGKPPTVEVIQVADGNDVLRGSLAGYDVELIQVEDEGTS